VTDTLEFDGNEDQQLGEQPNPQLQVIQEAVSETDLLRSLVAKAHPDAVPELLRGETLAEILASVEPAREAYQRIAEQVRNKLPAGSERNAEESVSAGVLTGPEGTAAMPTAERLRLGLRQRATART